MKLIVQRTFYIDEEKLQKFIKVRFPDGDPSQEDLSEAIKQASSDELDRIARNDHYFTTDTTFQ